MRVVLDTNVLISALLFHGRLGFIANALQHGTITPCFSVITWDELKRVLHYPHLELPLMIEHIEVEDLLARLKVGALFIEPTITPLRIPEDPSDEAFLACGIAARATAIVSGDKHLLAVASHFPIPIIKPQQFQSVLQHGI